MPSKEALVARREGEVVVVEWNRLGSFRSDRTPAFRADPGLSLDRARKMEQGPVRALQRYLNGFGSLHASAVVVGNDAVAFLGESGAGKSTAAALLCASRSAEILADDVLPILVSGHGAQAEDGDTSLWLLPASADGSGPKVSSRPKAAAGAFPLRLLVRLVPGPDEAFSVRRLRGIEALRAIAAAWIRFPLGYDERDFALIAELHENVVLLELVRPRDARQETLLLQLDMVFREFLGAPHGG